MFSFRRQTSHPLNTQSLTVPSSTFLLPSKICSSTQRETRGAKSDCVTVSKTAFREGKVTSMRYHGNALNRRIISISRSRRRPLDVVSNVQHPPFFVCKSCLTQERTQHSFSPVNEHTLWENRPVFSIDMHKSVSLQASVCLSYFKLKRPPPGGTCTCTYHCGNLCNIPYRIKPPATTV